MIVVLEGGYDLEALTFGVGATLSALVGESYRPEPASTGEIGLPDGHRRTSSSGSCERAAVTATGSCGAPTGTCGGACTAPPVSCSWCAFPTGRG